jgi:hypothetical protein
MSGTALEPGKGEDRVRMNGSLFRKFDTTADGVFVIVDVVEQLGRRAAIEKIGQMAGKIFIAVLGQDLRPEGVKVANCDLVLLDSVERGNGRGVRTCGAL